MTLELLVIWNIVQWLCNHLFCRYLITNYNLVILQVSSKFQIRISQNFISLVRPLWSSVTHYVFAMVRFHMLRQNCWTQFQHPSTAYISWSNNKFSIAISFIFCSIFSSSILNALFILKNHFHRMCNIPTTTMTLR